MPSLRVTAGLTSPPITLPTAVTASSSPYPRVPTCSVWVASSTRTAWPIWLAKLKMPSRTATTRSSRCRLSQRSPSAIWARMAGLGWPESFRLRGSLARSAAEPANERASRPNGSAAAAANSRLPAGGPRNVSPTVRLTCWLPLALGRSSGGTRAGSIAWAALLKMTSALPSSRPAMPRTAMFAIRKTTRTATAATTAACTAWARHMSVARS